MKWLKFDNSYFKDIKEKRDDDLLVLPTDAALFEDPSFKNYAEKYAEDDANSQTILIIQVPVVHPDATASCADP